ncbi:MAG: hypothetical protein A2081_00845 [Elusimicrobia bacterium GWC2_61_19]|nr:MAG: hypothetical protein A2081_00845 [Elusimicrobia bacterium GWC2_61_19]
MKKLLTAVFLLFMVLVYGTMTGANLLCGTAYAKSSKPKPDTTGPDGTDDGSGSGDTGSGPDDTDDGGGCGGGGSDSGGSSGPDDSGGGDF